MSARTVLLGLRKMSPMPPPLRSPSLSVVTMHMNSESQWRSILLTSSVSVFTPTVQHHQSTTTTTIDMVCVCVQSYCTPATHNTTSPPPLLPLTSSVFSPTVHQPQTTPPVHHHYYHWHGLCSVPLYTSHTQHQSVGLAINRSWVQILLGAKLRNNLGQVVHT